MNGQSRTVVCTQNQPIVDFLCTKGEEFQVESRLKLVKTVEKACISLCDHPGPITTASEARKVKNVGSWVIKLLGHFFDGSLSAPMPQPASAEPLVISVPNVAGPSGKRKRKYCPAKNSAVYALLITLLRARQSGQTFMRKQELIDEAEKTGLSTKPIRPNATSWTGGLPSSKEFYSGWSGMSTLITKCLVVKSSNPAKLGSRKCLALGFRFFESFFVVENLRYTLTEAGMTLAQECLDKSGLSTDNRPGLEVAAEDGRSTAPQEGGDPGSGTLELSSSSDDDIQEIGRSDFRKKNDFHFSSPQAGTGVDDLNAAFSQQNVLDSLPHLVPPVLAAGTESSAKAPNLDLPNKDDPHHSVSVITIAQRKAIAEMGTVDPNFELAVPPLQLGEKFIDAYEIICVLDNREQFRRRVGPPHSVLEQFLDSLRTQFNMKVEVRCLPVGDTLWIARHKRQSEEYVLDFVVERKNVNDLWMSIKDNRYKKQKLRMMNCGLQCLLYLVEGDVNSVESTESLKTAMFTTELHDGFRVLRTTDTVDTCRQYGHLTQAIISRYNMETGKLGKSGPACKQYDVFVEHCKDFLKDRIRDVFYRQLTQIGQVTEDVALSIQDRYPTLFFLAEAYRELEGNLAAQEKLLYGIPIRNTARNITVNMSRNIYKIIWAP